MIRFVARFSLLSCLAVLTISVTGCGEEAVEGKPAVGYGVATPQKASPIDNQLPTPPPLQVPPGAQNN